MKRPAQTWLRLLVWCSVAVASGACSEREREPEPSPPLPDISAVAFDSARVRIETATDTVHVRVDVAAREDQRAFGLMERTSLAEDAGMVFLYDAVQAPNAGFWMYRTRIPLDIAFFDSSGRIVAIRQMQPCASLDQAVCQVEARDYAPGAPYVGALEVNRGYFTRHGVRVGDRIIVERS